MNEEYVSGELYRAAVADPDVRVLSWQSVDGKGYFAADIKLRLPDQRRVEPDLVGAIGGQLWLVEVKAKHSEAVADEAKLAELRGLLGDKEILRQVRVRSGVDVAGLELVLAVAYYGDDLAPTIDEADEATIEPSFGCVRGVIHIDWEAVEPEVTQRSMSACFADLYAAQQSNT